MQINTLKIKYFKKKRKTIGRGGKKGTYSGKGGKGQKGRSGVSINPLFEGGRSSLIDRLKKVRGFKSDKPKAVVFKFSDLDDLFLLLFGPYLLIVHIAAYIPDMLKISHFF